MEVKLRNGNTIRIARVGSEHGRLKGASALVLSRWIEDEYRAATAPPRCPWCASFPKPHGA